MPSELATQTVAGLSAGTRQQAVGGSGLQHLLCNRKRRPNSAGCTRACSWLRLASQHPTCSEPFETITEFTRSAKNTPLVGVCRRFRASSDKSPEQTLALEPQSFDAAINLQQQPAARIAKVLNGCTCLATSQLILCSHCRWPLFRLVRRGQLLTTISDNVLLLLARLLESLRTVTHHVGAAHLGNGRARGTGRLRGRSVGSMG